MSADKKMKYHRYIVKPPSLKFKKKWKSESIACVS